MRKVAVTFPCIHAASPGELITITCFAAREMKGTIKLPAIGDEGVARRVIGASRHNETDHRAATGVIAMFSNPQFTGLSYTLALAIADKLARYRNAPIHGKIYATGKIAHDKQGQVQAIGGIAEKIRLILKNAAPGDCFIYPRANDEPALSPLLQTLREKGIRCIAIGHISDLAGVLWHPPETAAKPENNRFLTAWRRSAKTLPGSPASWRAAGLIGLALTATALLLVLTMNSHRATTVKDASADRPASNETASTIPGAAPVTTPPATRPVAPKPPTTTVKSKPAKRQLESGEIDLRAY